MTARIAARASLWLAVAAVVAVGCSPAPAPASAPSPAPASTPVPAPPRAPPASPSPAALDDARCTADSLTGDWRAEAGSDFEEISVDAGGGFSSFLHARPFVSGRWSIDGDALVLAGDDGTTMRIDGVRCTASRVSGTAAGVEVRWDRLDPP